MSVKEAIQPCLLLPNEIRYKDALAFSQKWYCKTHDVVVAVISSLFTSICLANGGVAFWRHFLLKKEAHATSEPRVDVEIQQHTVKSVFCCVF